MLEKDFARLYKDSQEREHAPSQLVEEARVQARRADAACSKPLSGLRRKMRRPKRALRVAACIAAMLVLVGGSTTLLLSQSPFGQPQARAYAKTPNLLTDELSDGVVPFALDSQTAFQGWGHDANGCYTGMQFTLEGDGIERVQATISRGELYQMTTETHDRSTEEGRAILNEAVSWKPLARGAGEYLGEYDWVTLYSVEDGLDRSDPNHQMQLRLINRIGSTIDLPYEGEALTFGMWFGDVKFLEDGATPDLHDLDGIELTITAAYSDGTNRTQTMVLHDGWFACTSADPEIGADRIMAEGPFDEKPKNTLDKPPYGDIVHTLYGKVTAITDEPHPYSLENANIRGDEIPIDISLEEEFGPSGSSTLTIDDTPSDKCIYDKNATVTFGKWGSEANDSVDLQLSGFSAYARDSLGTYEYISPYEGREVIAFLGNFDYLNRVRMWTNGWSMSKDGQINEENSLVMLNVDITNNRDESVKIETDHLGAICSIDREGNATTFATALTFAAKDNKARLWDRNNYAEVWFEPHETVNLHLAFIVDDSIANAEDVYYALGTFSGLMQDGLDEDLDDITYISLGKLDWK